MGQLSIATRSQIIALSTSAKDKLGKKLKYQVMQCKTQSRSTQRG